jgi:signal transduction histidine kinase
MSLTDTMKINGKPPVNGSASRPRFMALRTQPETAPVPNGKTPHVEQNFLQQILDISRHMAETRALEPLLNYVIDEAVKLVGAEQGYIVLVQPDGSLEIKVKRGRGGEELEGVEEDYISKSVFSEVVKTGQPLILRDAINDPHYGAARSVISLQLRSIMCVPFIARGETIGVLYVENRSIRNRFKEDDLPPLILFANQAAVAIENAALNDDLEARVADRTRELEKSWSEVVEANRLRTVWLSNVAHDLRAPLGITTASLSFLQEGGLGDLNNDQLTWVGKSLQAVHHTTGLINDLFDLFKMESGGIKLHQETVSLQEFLQNVYDVGLGLPRPEGVNFELDISTTTLPDVFIDLARIRQVVLNLLSNAYKFTTQGNVTLYAEYRPGDTEVLIGVRDTGEGIAAEKLDRLFNRFQQVDDNDERRRQGSGLGLAICRELVEMHGGRVGVESAPGVGSNFMFTLPLNPPHQSQ